MTNALDYSALYASYPSVNPATELYMPSNSLAFTRDGNHFVAGSVNEIAIFDTWRNGEGPVAKHKTADSRKLGNWMENRYLIIAERQSDYIQIFDVRNTLQRVSTLTGREANTTQKLGIDVVPTIDGSQVWAGGTDGVVKMWENPGLAAGDQKPQREMKLRKDPISSATWHPRGWVFATTSGHRFPNPNLWFEDSSSEDDESDSTSESSSGSSSSAVGAAGPDNKLDVWVM
ncbi:hypothetical protein KC322_g12875 [Hortaea werneckii]|nr:hypothetical protein KC322_g12875 [Hortaea werneckii]